MVCWAVSCVFVQVAPCCFVEAGEDGFGEGGCVRGAEDGLHAVA